jgi:hypothetical protein
MQRSANPFEAVPTNTVWRGQCPDNAGPSSLGTEPERYDGLGSKAGSKNSLIVLGPAWENTMAELTGRELHLLKKALAIAVLLIEQRPGPFQSLSDQARRCSIGSSKRTASWKSTRDRRSSLLLALLTGHDRGRESSQPALTQAHNGQAPKVY